MDHQYYVGLSFEVEHVRPTLSPWDLIIRCVTSLPDNFELQTGDLPPYYDDCVLVNRAVICKVQSCRSLGLSARDKFGKPRVDMVGVTLMNAAELDAFDVGTEVILVQQTHQLPPGQA